MKRLLDLYIKYMAIWVILGSVIAYLKPGVFVSMRSFMDLFFMLTMLGIGAVLKTEDFKGILSAPGIVVIGVISQFTIMPVSAFLISRLLHLPPEITLGLIIAGAAPGAMASNVLSYIAKADVAYSVSLTSVSTLITPLMTPLLTYILASSILKVDFWHMFLGLIKVVIIPLISGFGIRHYFSDRIEKYTKIFPAISATFIVFICSLVVAINRDRISDISFKVLIAVIVLNLGGMVMGYAVGKFFSMNLKRRRTLSIEIGMLNAGLGTVLALKYFSPQAAIPTAAFVFICIFTASIAAEFWKNKEIEGAYG